MSLSLAALPVPLIQASNVWGTWTALLASAAVGMWAEKHTQWGAQLSGPLVSTLAALLLANIGVLSNDSAVYGLVNKYLLTLVRQGLVQT